MMPAVKPILLVEDNENDLELTMAAFERAQLQNHVVTLRDGAEAIEYLRSKADAGEYGRETPAVILLDIKLPKVDGLEVLEFIKQNRELRKTPVVILSSSRENLDLERSYELGANAYVVKPSKFPDFLKAVQQLGQFWGVLNEPPPARRRA